MSVANEAKESGTPVEVLRVSAARDRRRFLELPYTLYRGHPHWVPPLRLAQKDILNTRRHPFYKTSDVEMFMARRGGRDVGRVMAIVNHAHNEFHGERTGFFGFFEAENDFDAARSLFDAAGEWVGSRGMKIIRGPMNPSTNYELGLLVEGFDSPPAVMMTYNPPYYSELVERCGFRKAIDLYAYTTSYDSFIISDKLKRVAERLRKKDRISVRAVNMKEFRREVEVVRTIYNDAWSRNWGFVPVSEEEFEHLAKDLKQIADPRVVLIAEQEVEGVREPKPIGFLLALPDINRALKKINGRLFPFGLLKFLWHSRKIDHLRVITMGIISRHQNLGVASVFYEDIYRRFPACGYPTGEMSWVLENNVLMNRAAEMVGARRTKVYRIYERSLQRG